LQFAGYLHQQTTEESTAKSFYISLSKTAQNTSNIVQCNDSRSHM